MMNTTNAVQRFQDLHGAAQRLAGGKGGMLAQLFQAGYPVPPGFVILPTAFADGQLTAAARQAVKVQWQALGKRGAACAVAVRSSALHEDSAQASFAGEFETVLNVTGEAALWAAIDTVYHSAQSTRVKAYSAAHGLTEAHQVAVVIQRMVPADLSGVLFTADPVTGSYSHMLGNFVQGLGEQLVAGEANAETFTLARPQGRYTGPATLQAYATTLYRYASNLEQRLGVAQDIEWAVAQGHVYLLQARPITTLSLGNVDTYEINESLTEDALWVNTNVAEAVPDVFSPLTWSTIRGFDNELSFIPGYYVWSGNICGRVYSNISRRVSVIKALTGWSTQRILGLLGDIFGQAPAEMQIPLHPFSRWQIIKEIVPRIGRVLGKMIRTNRTLPTFLQETPAWCERMTARIQATQSKAALRTLWQDELQPYTIKAWWAHTAGGSGIVAMMALDRKLTDLVGKEEANALLSNLRSGGDLASLGPLIGIARVQRGDLSRAAYLQQYGHRGPHEFELSIPHPAEDSTWLETQILEFEKAQLDVDQLLQQQQAQHAAAKQRFLARYPRKQRWLTNQIAKAAQGAQQREAARSEFVRVFRVVRTFALRAGALSGIGEEIFFLYQPEVTALLAGDEQALAWIPARKANYAKYQAMPPFPSLIRGRFDPVAWAKEPNRRLDYYDPTLPFAAPALDTLKGYAGAAGRVEGKVRVLFQPEAGDSLQPGEILVAATTNVGWTPLFPKAAAIITDIGAPLSHAAIVARELGIPAVVGCGNATSRLKTGDRVRVDGGQGIVQLIEQ